MASGVHLRGVVASLDLRAGDAPQRLLAALLPPQLAVAAIQEARAAGRPPLTG